MDLLKNKWVLIGVAAVVVIIGISIYVVSSNNSNGLTTEEETIEEEAVEMTPEEIGLILEPSKNGKEVVMTIGDTSKFTSFEYEMNYEAEVDGEMVSRGAIGSGEVEGEKKIERSITIGTCSSGTCKYDTGVKKISFVLRLNLKTGETALVKSDLNLE